MPLSQVAGFDVTVAELIDARFLITASANRFDSAYFDSGNTITGLTTFASESQEYFILSDQPNFGNELGWSKIYTSDPGGTDLYVSGSISASNGITASGIGITSTIFTGQGSGLSNLPAGQLTGIVPADTISGNYTGITAVGPLNSLSVNGDTNLGNSSDDTHTFTGNITASANISASGNLIITNITASGISASGELFAQIPQDTNGSSPNVVVYNPTTGEFEYTGSYSFEDQTLQEVMDLGSTTSVTITSSAEVALSGSGDLIVTDITSSNIGLSGDISASGFLYDASASPTSLYVDGTITASGDISSSQTLYSNNLEVATDTTISGDLLVTDITSSNISASVTISGSDGYFVNGSNIGPAEDGTYTDGLFTDFTTGTKVGTAVDRFNEILLALCPSPAPNMQTLGGSTGFIAANLAFGASNPITSPFSITNVTAVGNLDALDAGDFFPLAGGNSDTISGSNGNFRLGVNPFANGYQNFGGKTNQSIAQDGGTNGNAINYNAFSFGNGNEGELYFYLNNDDTPHLTLDLESSDGEITEVNGGLTLEVSPTSSGFFPNGTPFTSFTHRSGSYTFATNKFYGRDGMNFIKIIHTSSTFERETNYIQWVTNPTGSDDVTWGGYPLKYEGEGLKYLSGVKYHTGARAEYYILGDNFYKYMYSNEDDAIQIEVEKGGNTFQVNQIYQSGSLEKTDSAGNSSLYSVSVVDVDGKTGCHERDLYLTASISGGALVNNNRALIADNNDTNNYLKIWTKQVQVVPSNRIANAGGSTDIVEKEIKGILIDNRTNNDTLQSETFVSESHRLLPHTYDSQADVTDSEYEWDSSVSIEDNGTDGYSESLLVMPRWVNNGSDTSGEGMLVYPDRTSVPANGNFASFTNGPDSNVDYSTSTGNRTFYRRFRNVSGNTLSSFIINLRSWDTALDITPQGGNLGTNNLYFHVKLPGETAWLDMGTALAQNSTDDLTINNAPGRLGSLASISTNGTDYTVSVATSVTSFSVNNNEYIVVRLRTGDTFNGKLRSITIEDFE